MASKEDYDIRWFGHSKTRIAWRELESVVKLDFLEKDRLTNRRVNKKKTDYMLKIGDA